jgi:hypothetical protein
MNHLRKIGYNIRKIIFKVISSRKHNKLSKKDYEEELRILDEINISGEKEK